MDQRAVEAATGKNLPEAEHRNGFCLQAETLIVSTQKRVELINLTDRLAAQVRASGVRNGLALVTSLHTTLALFINEFQAALLDDIRTFLEQAVVRGNYYKHNDPKFSDCDRFNADSHLRALLLGHHLTLPVKDGELLLGTFQSVILAELDGPRERALQVQVLGV
jgi:secondary thiamine-phosphate synthase enzyme